MKQITLNIQESNYQFFLELLESLEFVQVENIEGDTKSGIVKNLKRGFKDLKKYKEGTFKTTPAREFLHML